MKLKKLFLVIALLAFAAESPVARAAQGQYSAQEFNYDLFGTWASRDREDFDKNQLGLGVGANYFFTEFIGLGADTYVEDFEFPNHLDLSLIGRWPLDMIPIAPYGFAGFGRQWKDSTQWTTHFGLGVEYRWQAKKGVFLDVRRVIADKTQDLTLLRLGVRFGF